MAINHAGIGILRQKEAMHICTCIKQIPNYMRRILSLLILMAIALFLGCHKTEDQQDDPNSFVGPINGHIVLPSGSAINSDGLVVHSPIASIRVSDSKFTVSCFANVVSSLIVTDSSNNVLLLGACNPMDDNKDVSVLSTAKALILNTPAALCLLEEGKISLMNNVADEAEFSNLQSLIEANLAAKRDLFDSLNTAIFASVDKIMKSASTKKMASNALDPVMFWQSNNTFAFYNDGSRIFSSIVGIYKDGKRIEKVEIAGIPLFPSSLKDLVDGNFRAAVGKPDPIYYTFTADGKYELKMRTGLPEAGDNSQEFEDAFILNVQQFSYYFMKTFVPALKLDKLPCFLNIGQDGYKAWKAYNSTTRSVLLQASKAALSSAKDLEKCINGNSNLFDATFFKKMSDYVKVWEKAFIPASVSNTVLYSIQWGLIKPSFDTCFVMNTEKMFSCNGYRVGDTAFGGIICYLDNTGKHGMAIGLNEFSLSWDDNCRTGTNYTPRTTNAMSATFGSGMANTNKITSALGAGNYAALKCSDYSNNGFSDWYLPSKDELNEINKNSVKLPLNGRYWSSTELIGNVTLTFAWFQDFPSGTQNYNGPKDNVYFVRPVRSF